MNLDKLLKKVEKNALNKDKQEVKKLIIGDDEFEVLTMTRKEKCDFIYSRKATQSEMNVGELVKWAKPFIYRSLQLKDLAIKSIDAGYIQKYHDIVDYLFEPTEVLEIIAFITEINNIAGTQEEEIEEIKKQ